MKPYPKYKPSEIQWLGNIPEHWEVKKLKYVSSINDEVLPENTDKNFRFDYVDIESVTEGKILNPKDFSFAEAPSRARRIVVEGDVIVSTVRTYLKAIAQIKSISKPTIVSTGFAVIRSSKIVNKEFLNYLLRESTFIDSVMANSKGVSYPAISSQELKEIVLTIPPLPEQTAIAQFLDQKTAQIDTLIAQKQRLISLLKEERMAFINEILSDESFPLKKLKYVTKGVQTGSTPPSDKSEYFNGNFDWFTPSDFKYDLILRNSKRKITDLAITHGLVKVYEPHSVLMIGIGATLGKIGLIEKEASSNQQVNCITFTDEINPYFGAHFLNSISQDIVSMANAATLAILNQSQTKDIKIPCPSLEIQQKIVESIETTTGKIDATLAKVVQEIELLKEYRVALISEVVTGKISVV